VHDRDGTRSRAQGAVKGTVYNRAVCVLENQSFLKILHSNGGKVMEKESVIKKLSEKIQGDAVQRTKASETKKGYDTDGYGYQYIVDRFNEICGADWGFSWRVIKEMEGEYKSGAKFHEVTVEVGIWVMDRTNARTCAGGHISMSYADALKGAITNGFKKTAAFWGVGRDAYAGTIDDDNVPLPDDMNNIKTKSTAKISTKEPTKRDVLYKTFLDLFAKCTEGQDKAGKKVSYEATVKKLFVCDIAPDPLTLTENQLEALNQELAAGK
jgi:hypothetical protein